MSDAGSDVEEVWGVCVTIAVKVFADCETEDEEGDEFDDDDGGEDLDADGSFEIALVDEDLGD